MQQTNKKRYSIIISSDFLLFCIFCSQYYLIIMSDEAAATSTAGERIEVHGSHTSATDEAVLSNSEQETSVTNGRERIAPPCCPNASTTDPAEDTGVMEHPHPNPSSAAAGSPSERESDPQPSRVAMDWQNEKEEDAMRLSATRDAIGQPSVLAPQNDTVVDKPSDACTTVAFSRSVVSVSQHSPPPLIVVEPPKPTERRKKESYFVYVNRLTLIDTAEDTNQWANRAKHQWGGDASSSSNGTNASGVSIRISSQSVVRGRTPPKPLQFSPVWTGVTWSKHDAGILVPLEEDAMLVVEVVVVTDSHSSSASNTTNTPGPSSPERVLGMGLINAQAIVDEERQWGKFCVHLLPSLYPLDSLTVHAVVEFSILSSTAVEEEESELAAQRWEEGRLGCRSSSSPTGTRSRETMMEEEEEDESGNSGGAGESSGSPAAPASLVVAATGTATGNPGGGDVGFTTLEYNYGAVRVSTVDFFYPPFFLSGSGQYIVSNVLCAMNMTESSALAMQLVPLKEGCEYLQTSPPSVITVRPQQRAYFTATWDLKKEAYRGQRLELELLVHGTHTPSARILLQVHHTTPHNTASDVPYMYWVNNTCLCNRQMVTPEELPCLKEVLPVYRLLSTSQRSGSSRFLANRRRPGRNANASSSTPPTAGASASPSNSLVGANGNLSTANYSSSHIGGGASISNRAAYSSGKIEEGALDINASFVLSASARDDVLSAARAAVSAGSAPQKQHPHPLQTSTTTTPQGHTRRVFHRGPLLDIQQRTCHCSITLGPIRGFPFLESLSGQPNAFRIAITLLDKVGWKVLVGETRPSYPTASGSLQWNETLHLQKWPGAVASQFCRLHLSEVRSTDGDETPIGAGLISVGNLGKIHECVPLSVAFSVYETYSQYDQMISPSLLMKDITLRFSDIR